LLSGQDDCVQDKGFSAALPAVKGRFGAAGLAKAAAPFTKARSSHEKTFPDHQSFREPNLSKPKSATSESLGLSLALQGGGSHGAFTWGVLDRLLEEEGILLEGFSGTSAGAMNAVVLADGFLDGGRAGAREALARFWRRISDAALASPLQPTPLDILRGDWSLEWSPSYLWLDLMSRLVSPYQANPLNLNPLRDVLLDSIDFARLRDSDDLELFICATNVRKGDIRVFHRHELTVDALLASACIPFLFQAVEVEGEPYWDGGYMGNPALFPLIEHCRPSDIVIVQINPVLREEVPTNARSILDRVNEISFNATLLRELRSIETLSAVARDVPASGHHLRDMKIHLIADKDTMAELGFSSKLNARWEFLEFLREKGRAAAEAWLKSDFQHCGHCSSFNVRQLFA
jgi:NTE family protein